jgi:hypothetical protein
MNGTTSDRRVASLTMNGGSAVQVSGETELEAALSGLERLVSGQVAVLARGARDYIKAVRYGDLWSVTVRQGSYFTLASFTAALTTDWSEREVRESRAAGTLWGRFKRWMASPYPERALSTSQVERLFVEYLLGSSAFLSRVLDRAQ